MPRSFSSRASADGKPLTVRVNASLDRRLQAAAAREGLSVSDYVREAITERLERGAVETSLWDRIAPSVVQGEPRPAARRSRTPPGGTHEEFAAGLEADAAAKWHRGDA